MTFDINRPYQTREGLDVWAAVAPKPFEGGRQIVGIVDFHSRRLVWTWFPDGRATADGNSPNDLVNIPEKRTIKAWINMYEPRTANFSGLWPSRADADANSGNLRIACIERELTYEVGEGL